MLLLQNRLTQAMVFCGRAIFKGPKNHMWLESHSLPTMGLSKQDKGYLDACFQSACTDQKIPKLYCRRFQGREEAVTYYRHALALWSSVPSDPEIRSRTTPGHQSPRPGQWRWPMQCLPPRRGRCSAPGLPGISGTLTLWLGTLLPSHSSPSLLSQPP